MVKNTALADRYPLWFDQNIGFVGSTDEKQAITGAINSVMDELAKTSAHERPVLSGTHSIKFADLGCAAGVLGKMVSDNIYDVTGSPIHYTGVDVNPHMHDLVLSNVKGEAFRSVDFQLGSSEHLAKIRPDVILASHIYYYPDNAAANPAQHSKALGSSLDTALRQTVSSMEKDGLALIAHESRSDFDPIKRKYGAHVEADTTLRLDDMLKPTHSSAASTLSFNSHIYFPHLDDSQWERLKQAEHYDVNTNPYGDNKLLNARILAEFMIHQPLENMESEKRGHYIDDLKHIVNKGPLITIGTPAEKFGPVHEMTNVNQLIMRTHHKNRAAGVYIKQVAANIGTNYMAA